MEPSYPSKQSKKRMGRVSLEQSHSLTTCKYLPQVDLNLETKTATGFFLMYPGYS